MEINNDLEYIRVGRVKLTDRALNQIVYRIENRYGLNVVSIEETNEGYVFKGKYGFTIGDVRYDQYTGRYTPFNFHHGVIESISAKDREEKIKRETARRKQYKLQKNIAVGVTFTAAAIITLTALGVMKVHHDKIQQPETPSSEVVTQVSHLNTLKSANDLILLEWANYAMGGVTDDCANSQYEAIQNEKSDIYANLYVPIMSKYYDYLDMMDSGLPLDIVSESISKNHQEFRSSAEQFNSYLKNEYFGDYAFENSPYADAVVMDQSGHVISVEGELHGELKDSEGKVITFDGDSAQVYIKAISIPGQSYNLENLPADAIIYNGEAYILSSHLNDELTQGMNK